MNQRKKKKERRKDIEKREVVTTSREATGVLQRCAPKSNKRRGIGEGRGGERYEVIKWGMNEDGTDKRAS